MSNTIKVQFEELFNQFRESCDLFLDATVKPIDTIEKLKSLGNKRIKQASGPAVNEHWDEKDEKDENDLVMKLIRDLKTAAKQLPGRYRENYVEPLLKHLESVQHLSPGIVDTLAAAVLDHNEDSGMTSVLRGFLALVSNLYRSFLEPEQLPLADFPQPQSKLPALATFRRKLDLDSVPAHLDFAPFTLPVDEVDRLCAGKVAVVSLPSCYRQHPVLSWACVAHEAGGHDVLHSYPGLLPELKQGVRELFYQGPDPHCGNLTSDRQFLGLLWQHWTEETASDVFAVMNLGPCYGIALAIYFAALSARFRKQYHYGGEDLPTLAISSRVDDQVVDYHPIKILSLYAVMGAIQGLIGLSEDRKKAYIDAIENCTKICLQKNKELLEMGLKAGLPRQYMDLMAHYDPEFVRIQGWMQLKAGGWIQFDRKNYYLILSAMREHAYRVGYYIATAKLRNLNNHSIQDLETWDESDDAAAQNVEESICNPDVSLNAMGDDAQLFAGAMLKLCAQPNQYAYINKRLSEALTVSFTDDEIWGDKPWHPIANQSSERSIPPEVEKLIPKRMVVRDSSV